MVGWVLATALMHRGIERDQKFEMVYCIFLEVITQQNVKFDYKCPSWIIKKKICLERKTELNSKIL